jgi:hypothetical protein
VRVVFAIALGFIVAIVAIASTIKSCEARGGHIARVYHGYRGVVLCVSRDGRVLY